ncbi:MAG: hypothetical protein E7619_09165 [Ruminococcaceae bacterium]|nr:hypothetical protein [Oscillospiraceae bacterium]
MLIKELQDRSLPPLKSRKEMSEILQKEVYGYLPKAEFEIKVSDPKVIERRFACGKVIYSRVDMEIKANGKSHSFPIGRLLHNDGKKHPLIVYPNFHPIGESFYFPIEELSEYDADILFFCYKDAASDDGDMQNGLASLLLPKGQAEESDCGKIGIWAWTSQRVLDYGLTLDGTDADNVCIAGHSRLGKTALYCAMTDERFKFVLSNASGCAGASLARGNSGNTAAPGTKGRGETYKDIIERFPYWFCKAFHKYAETNIGEDFDQHYLLASIAPRFVLVGSCSLDGWADPRSEQLCSVAASAAWNNEDCTKALAARYIEGGEAVLSGSIGYFKLTSQHFMSRHSWRRLMEFIELHRNETI